MLSGQVQMSFLSGGSVYRQVRSGKLRALAMRPHDARDHAITLPDAPDIDATVAYVATRSPISDPYARYQQAEKMKRDSMVNYTKTYFNPWETIHEGNPHQMLARRAA